MRQQIVIRRCRVVAQWACIARSSGGRSTLPRGIAWGAVLAVVLVNASPLSIAADDPLQNVSPRAAWTTSRVVGSPQPPTPYTTENAFPHLTFDQPVELLPIPGTKRFIVAELNGRIDSFLNDPNTEQRDLFLDLKAHQPEMLHVYGLAFHPRFAENRQLFVCYVLPGERPDGSRISRFRVEDTNPPRVDPESEEILLTWLSGGHNGCCLQFGPDGYLYISTGDGTGPSPPDTLNAGQDLTNLLSAILRIDVDHVGPERAYRIPEDNPFVAMPEARPEIWAYGFRNPWRMSFDAASGDLWVGDVGWELWEMVYRVTRGGNYGWSIMEGRQPINLDGPRGPTPIVPPVVDHPHSEAASITGGYVYWGDRLEDLRGAYVYGDFETGKVWGLRLDQQGEVAWHEELADTPMRIVSFGVDQENELYLVDHGGTIHRLIPNPEAGRTASFPRRLSETGLFESVADQQPAAGVVPYSINATMWQDGATSRRWIALPGTARVQATDGKWSFPEGAVLVKTLSLTAPDGREVNVETQLLHFNGSTWNGYSYRWDESQQDAELVPAEGDQAQWTVLRSPGGEMDAVSWQYASRADCLRCHNPWSGPPLAFDAMHLNRDVAGQGQSFNQLKWLDAVAVTGEAARRIDRPALVDPHDASRDITQRARSYLHVNCAHCHRMNAGGSVPSQMPFDLPLDQTQMVAAPPTQGDLSIEEARVIAPGDPRRSVLLHRIAKTGQGRMPRLGSEQVDRAGLALLYRWVEQMDETGHVRPPSEQAGDGSPQHANQFAAWLTTLSGDATADGGRFASHIHSPADALDLVLAMDRGELEPQQQEWLAAAATAHPQPIVRDLFERFLPEEQRRERLGDRIDPQKILTLEGNPRRGEELFFTGGLLQCSQCHQVAGRGKPLGPELSEIGAQRSPQELLESLLNPSRTIDPKYQTYLVETVDGRALSGLLIERSAERVTLRDAEHRDVEIAADDIEQLIASPQSIMPDGVLRELTAQEAADLLAYLTQLRTPPGGIR